MKKKKSVHGDIRDLESIGDRNFKQGMLEVTEKELRIGEEPRKSEKKNFSGKKKGR